MRKAAIAGVGYTAFSKSSGRSVLDLAVEAAGAALADAGLDATQVDGVGSFMVLSDSVSCGALSTALALPRLRWSLDFQNGGQSPCHVIGQAASAVATGQADNIVVFRALNGRSGTRVGSGEAHRGRLLRSHAVAVPPQRGRRGLAPGQGLGPAHRTRA